MTPRRDRFEGLFRALGHAGRRRLLGVLAEQDGRTLNELSDTLPMTRQAVSQHLALLEQAGLVLTRWHGREKLHYLNPLPLVEVWEGWMQPLVTGHAQALASLRVSLEVEASAPRAAGADG